MTSELQSAPGIMLLQAWTNKQVCLQHDAEGTLRFRVLSQQIWDKSPVELCDQLRG